MIEFEGIVIRITPFRDNDAMVNVISKDKMHSFLARGVMKYESKNAPSIGLYAKGRYQLSKGKDGFSLRSGELLESYQGIKNNLSALAVVDLIGEITNKLVQAEDAPKVYDSLVKILELLNSGFDAYTLASIYIAHVLNVIGYGLEVDRCVLSGQTSPIVAISYQDGGFIAQSEFDPLNHVKCTSRKLKIIRYIFKVDPDNYAKIAFEKEEMIEIIGELSKFIYDALQINLKSVNLIEKL